MDIVVLDKTNWEPSELTYVEQHLGPIVSPNTYKAIVLDRTPGGYRWYAWERRREGWLVVAGSLGEMVEEVKEKEVENGNKNESV
jgi:hypothetical protein